ncbi:orotidine-5'-phosphate decarboxylase [Tamilnaduibacter salinus]|uniref:Orotidine 5'-phosphate decarboxylase n=1 Tax=Tamilnaduibacter salinus TaxID=1484056 RepID=A0A2A2I5T3_9GAMM|nr:orotidine-5'-phosphate decarboxylase [Tamilnaduibacter salinus]PAV26666.1 orotidine-5'-phosphate decarboxylase [Tamilnaduibacter salinus]
MLYADVTGPRVIVALDFADQTQGLELVDQLDPGLCRLKVGKEMFTRFGPDFVRQLTRRGFGVFLDLKYHDIPNTAAAAVEAAADLGVWMVNVHASGGETMMAACRERLEKVAGNDRPLLIGVTVLTSFGADDLRQIGVTGSPEEQVDRLSSLAYNAGLDGVVCSAQEAPILRESRGPRFQLVTPGIRPAFAATDDQKRIMTPSEALYAGSDYLVIGRPITQADRPLEALEEIQAEVTTALN